MRAVGGAPSQAFKQKIHPKEEGVIEESTEK